MQNIATVYRFNTPFLDVEKEKKLLLIVIEKIKSFLQFDWISFEERIVKNEDYYKITLILWDDLWKIDFFYINHIWEYYLPIFKLDLFLNQKFLLSENNKKRAVKFLTNIFECFDWLNEKEYLIELDQRMYYNTWFFKNKNFPKYDFTNISTIQKEFESKKWIQLLQDFIVNFKNKDFLLTKENSKEYHKIHSLLLYFIYLIFIMHENIVSINNTQKWLENIDAWSYEAHKKNIEQRLSFVWDLNMVVFKQYKEKLELLLQLFF